MELVLLLLVMAPISQVHPISLTESIIEPYSKMLQENIASTRMQQQINSSMENVIANMAGYDVYVRNLTDQILGEYSKNIQQKALSFSSNMKSLQRSRTLGSGNNIVLKCLIEEGQLNVLATQINEQVKRCATVAMAEMVNVVTNSLKETQTFMALPRVIGKDIQRCGLSYSCRWDIVGDAISEALEVPPKVYALTAKIQSIALHTVVSVDRCGIQGLKEITETAIVLLENIFRCIINTIDSSITSNPS